MAAITGSVGEGGVNRPPDVQLIQTLLNQHIQRLAPLSPLAVDGLLTPALVTAIKEYQRRILGVANPDGRVDPGGRTLRSLNEPPPAPVAPGTIPPWVTIARAEIGVREMRGVATNNPRVLEYIASFPYLKDIWNDEIKKEYKLGHADETAWCACFVNWCLLKAGKPKGPSARAKDWMTYGTKLTEPRPGAICVVFRTPSAASSGVTASGYHVAFWMGGDASSIVLLGGNQTAADKSTEEVNEKKTTGYWTVQAYRWPV
jgi:uncharacterized protein (TIGR02594 family)